MDLERLCRCRKAVGGEMILAVILSGAERSRKELVLINIKNKTQQNEQ